MQKVVAIVQARMGSSRLPGKVLKQLVDKTVLGHVITRLQSVKNIDEIIVATTVSPEDEAIVQEAEKYEVRTYRGSEQDVLARYYEAAVLYKASTVVRITSDCPLIDPKVTDKVIEYFFETEADYTSNSLNRTFPRGLDTEVFKMSALEEAYRIAQKPEQREHVTPYIYQNQEKFKFSSYRNEIDYSAYRWTLDTQEDWNLIEEIYHRLHKEKSIFSWESAIQLMKDYPYLSEINAHVEQKKLGE